MKFLLWMNWELRQEYKIYNLSKDEKLKICDEKQKHEFKLGARVVDWIYIFYRFIYTTAYYYLTPYLILFISLYVSLKESKV